MTFEIPNIYGFRKSFFFCMYLNSAISLFTNRLIALLCNHTWKEQTASWLGRCRRTWGWERTVWRDIYYAHVLLCPGARAIHPCLLLASASAKTGSYNVSSASANLHKKSQLYRPVRHEWSKTRNSRRFFSYISDNLSTHYLIFKWFTTVYITDFHIYSNYP